MPRFECDADAIRTIVLTPVVTRAFWAQPRAWHGDHVRLHIETQHVPDGTPVAVEIWEDDSAEGNADDFLTRIEDDLRIENGRCVFEHELVWDDDTLGEPGEDEGGAYEFYFKAFIEDYAIEGRSNLLYVAIEPFKPSG